MRPARSAGRACSRRCAPSRNWCCADSARARERRRGTDVLLDGRFRFDNFVVGASNRLAVSAARAIAESPGAVYNPLFVYGGSGLGKTHLIAAAAHHAREVQGSLRAEYVTLDD